MKYLLFLFFSLIIGSGILFSQNTISILYFENTTADEEYQWLSKGLTDMLISDMSALPAIKIIERASLEKILEEQALSQTGLTDQGSAIEIGKLFCVPPFPGVVNTVSIFELSDNFQEIACSLPPEPKTRALSNNYQNSDEYIFEDLSFI